MKPIYKFAITTTVLALSAVATSRLINDGGIQAVMKDEVPALLDEWSWANGSRFARYAALIPASFAVVAGVRAGEADYDRTAQRDALTRGIPLERHDEIIRNSNLAAAQRARSRQLRRLASQDTEQRFFDLFPSWYADQTACLNSAAELTLIHSLAPAIAARIETTNTEFAALAQKEADGTLTVAERKLYLANPLRVPHLVQTGSEWHQWREVDPSDPLSMQQSDGPLVRECPDEQHTHGWRIKSCFGYVNIDLHGLGSPLTVIDHQTPTHLGLATYQELERSGEPVSFVYDMLLELAAQAKLKQQAEEIVASLPAHTVSAAFVEWRIKAEYEKLRCEL